MDDLGDSLTNTVEPVAAALARGHDRTADRWVEFLAHCSGFEREAAARALQPLRHGPALPALLARANDWVPQVRETASRALLALMDDRLIESWATSLEAVVALDRARRTDHRELRAAMVRYLTRTHALKHVMAAAGRESTAVRRYVFGLRWSACVDGAARLHLLDQVLEGADMALLEPALARVDALDADPRHQRVLVACRSPSARTRSEGLRRVLAHPGSDAAEQVLLMCLDDSPLIRSVALQAARSRGLVAQACAMAFDRFRGGAGSRHKAAALQFLCAAAPSDARRLCEDAVRSRAAVLRRVAFGQLLLTAPEAEQEPLRLRVLSDPSPRVRRLVMDRVKGDRA